MNPNPQNLRVLVTGAATGIGWAIAQAFLNQENHVHICDIAQAQLKKRHAEFPTLGVSLVDVSDAEQVETLFENLQTQWGGLDVLVNNVGIAGPTKRVEEILPEEWHHTFAVNVSGHFYCTRKAIPLLKQSERGTIVNIASTAGFMGYPLRAPYAASKWAVIGFTKTLAMELGDASIRANVICPGAVAGPRMDSVIAKESEKLGISEERIRENYAHQTSLRTFVHPQDIAHLVLFLCSEAGNKISGQVLSVDGNTETLRA